MLSRIIGRINQCIFYVNVEVMTSGDKAKALADLEEAQLPEGAFPWWSGGPPSPYVTLYTLQGLSRALEYDVEIPRELVEKAWAYMKEWWVSHPVKKRAESGLLPY